MSLEEAFKLIEEYCKNYELSLVLDFYKQKVFLHHINPDGGIVKFYPVTNLTLTSTWQEKVFVLAVAIQDGRI